MAVSAIILDMPYLIATWLDRSFLTISNVKRL